MLMNTSSQGSTKCLIIIQCRCANIVPKISIGLKFLQNNMVSRSVWPDDQTLIANKLLVNPEKLIKKFSDISILGSWAGPYYWKTHPYDLHEYLFSFCKISDRELDRITGKLIRIWMSFPVIRSVLCPKILKLTIGWVFQQYSLAHGMSLMPRKLANKG